MSDTLAPIPSGPAGVPVTPAAVIPAATSDLPTDAASLYKAARADIEPGAAWGAPTPPTEGMAVTDGEVETPAPAPEGASEFVQDDAGRWHRPDGTFANESELAAITAELAATPAATETPAAEPSDPAENVVTLRRRDGTTRDVLVDDAELAQEIRQNMNDGLRKREYTEKMAEAEALASEYREFRTMMAANPESIIFDHLPEPKRIALAGKLLAQYFDELVPVIQAYDANPRERITAVAEAQKAAREQEGTFRSLVASQRQAAEVKSAVAALVPDATDDTVAGEFWELAALHLTRAVDAGQSVTKDTVGTLLKTLTTHYGFTPAGAAPASAKPRISLVQPTGTLPPAVAAPVGTAANALADAQRQQKRIKLTQRNRANAAAIPPAGAGSSPLRLPPAPKGQSIEQASADLRKAGRSW